MESSLGAGRHLTDGSPPMHGQDAEQPTRTPIRNQIRYNSPGRLSPCLSLRASGACRTKVPCSHPGLPAAPLDGWAVVAARNRLPRWLQSRKRPRRERVEDHRALPLPDTGSHERVGSDDAARTQRRARSGRPCPPRPSPNSRLGVKLGREAVGRPRIPRNSSLPTDGGVRLGVAQKEMSAGTAGHQRSRVVRAAQQPWIGDDDTRGARPTRQWRPQRSGRSQSVASSHAGLSAAYRCLLAIASAVVYLTVHPAGSRRDVKRAGDEPARRIVQSGLCQCAARGQTGNTARR